MRQLNIMSFCILLLGRNLLAGHAGETIVPNQREQLTAGTHTVISRTDYVDGVPVIFYKGKKCNQSSTQNDANGLGIINITCYDKTLQPQRQCSFQWVANTGKSKLDINTYEKSRTGEVEKSVQSNSVVISRLGVKLNEVPRLATEWLNRHCADERFQVSKTTFEEMPGFTLKSGVRCKFERITANGAAAPTDLNIYCHAHEGGKSLQCGVNTNTILKNEETKPAPFEAWIKIYSDEGNITHQDIVVNETIPRKQFGLFHQQAEAWLEKKCHW